MHDNLTHARGWFLKADSDITAAERVMAGSGPYDSVCFHAQQAAEKYLKGLLALRGQPIPHIHDLVDLETICVALEPDLSLDTAALAELTPYAVELRYDFEFWPDEATAREALTLADGVRNVVLTAVPPEARP